MGLIRLTAEETDMEPLLIWLMGVIGFWAGYREGRKDQIEKQRAENIRKQYEALTPPTR